MMFALWQSAEFTGRGLDPHPHWDSVFFWGFVATVAMTSLLTIGQSLRLTRMSLPLLLGTFVTGDWDRALVYGSGLHFAIGWVFAVLYAVTFETWGRVAWWLGALVGLVHGTFVLAVLMPLLPSMHPRIASEHGAPDSPAMLEPPGFLALNYGPRTPLITLAAHLVYGAVLGMFYRLRVG